jgi:hypothetical protein
LARGTGRRRGYDAREEDPSMLAKRLHLVALAAAASVLAACGGSDDDSYTAFGSAGAPFELKADLSSGDYEAAGIHGRFAADAASGNYTFDQQLGAGKTARFRALPDLLVGNIVLGGSQRTFDAARRFAASAQEAAGSYNLLGATHSAAGVEGSLLASVRIGSDATMRACVTSPPVTVEACPAAALRQYTLAWSGADIVASPASGNDALRFRVALSGAEKVMLQADSAPDGTHRFAVGLQDAFAGRGGTAWAASTDGAWSRVFHDTINLSSEGVGPGGAAANYSGTMAPMAAPAPAGLRNFETHRGYVAQDSQLMVVLGAAGTDAAGYLQIGARP